eukprot:TRINITY_DN4153_c0_g2_i1.p1 TRINITY_DN4153_c0_g2~~TRINITY_DN4153_c0_g2_i1.p1  ORF type:complete len:138 (-),score=13.06 TRINITY_DN4153_c0_g2_i1:21-434(-)
MKLLSVCTFLSCIFSMRSQQCNPDWRSCSNVADVATITCDNARGVCSIENGNLTLEEDLSGLVNPEFSTIDAKTCRKKCQEHADTDSANKCAFFRWNEDHSATKKTTCSLQTTCEHDPFCDSLTVLPASCLTVMKRV